jgi:hypothetical protein
MTAVSTANDLADRVETTYSGFAEYIGQLSPEEWRAQCGNHPTIRAGDEDENRPVGTVAHHTAVALPRLVGMLRAVVAGEPIEPPSSERVAEHARSNPDPDQGETVALLRRNATDAGEYVRSLSDDELARTGQTMAGELSAAEVVSRVFVGHAIWHEGSIKASLGNPL